jgi:type IV secretory pathway VirB2 component (pilin)
MPSTATATVVISHARAGRPCVRLVDAVGSAAAAILQSIEGPVAKIIAVIIIIVTGLTLAFGDTSRAASAADPDRVRPVDRLRRQSSFFLSFFSFGGGALV